MKVGNSLHIPNDKLPGSNGDIPHVFIGDEAFPLMKNFMRPYPRCRGLSEAQTIINERLFNEHAKLWKMHLEYCTRNLAFITKVLM